ncbi:MAG: NADPH:quinone oxidoreductase family protein [Anaerolineales bacterium]
MKAILCKEWGLPADLVFGDAPRRPLQAGEIRLRVQAAGVNFADALLIAGKYQARPEFPFSPGFEAAGVVLECAPDVTRVTPGQRVIAFGDYGAYAEEMVVVESSAIPIPDDVDFVMAASFGVAYSTSHLALTHRGNLAAGETLLVLGAAGGVGLAAIEIGKHLGATVIAAASSAEKLQVAAEHGADHGINYAAENLRRRVKELTGGRGADVICDPVGGDLFDQAMRTLAVEGRILVIGFASGRIPELPVNRLLLKNTSAVGVFWGAYLHINPRLIQDSLATLLNWYGKGALRPHVSQTYPLEQAARALGDLLSRRATGRIVLTTGAN